MKNTAHSKHTQDPKKRKFPNMTLAKDTLNTLLWLSINSIPLCLHRAGSRKHTNIAENRKASNCCNVYCSHS